MKILQILASNGYTPYFEGDDSVPDNTPDKGKTFTQEDVDRIINERMGRYRTEQQELVEELTALREREGTSKEDRANLTKRINALNDQLKTKEEQAREESERLKTDYEARLQNATEQANTWRSNYQNMRIDNEIVGAASIDGQRAHNPQQILALLRPMSEVREILDDDKEPTGQYEVRIKLPSKDKDGKPITLDLDPREAVKRLSESEENYNLFEGSGIGGTGGRGGTRSGSGANLSPVEQIRSNPQAYAEQRKKERRSRR